MKHINEYNDYEKNLLYQGDNKAKFFLASLIKDLEIRHFDGYPNKDFFIHKKTQKLWMENTKDIGYLYVSYEHIWEKIESEFSYNDLKIKRIIADTVKIAFNLNDIGIPIYYKDLKLPYRITHKLSIKK